MSKIVDIDNKSTQIKLAKRFITNLLELGGLFKVNDETGMIAYADTPDDPILLKYRSKTKQDEEKTLVVYQYDTPIKDAVMVNPFIEQISSTSAERVWFYNVTNRCHTLVFSHILEYIIESMVKASKGETLDNPDILTTLSAIVGDFDVKSEKEIAAIIKKIPEYEGELDDDVLTESSRVLTDTNTRDFISIVRQVKEKKAYLTSFLQDDEDNFRKKFGTRVRKKTFALIENIFRSIYRINNFNVPLIEHESNSVNSPSFIAYCKVLIESWNRFIPFLQYIWDQDTVENMVSKIVMLEEIMPHIEKIAASSVYSRSNVDGIIQDRNGVTRPERHNDIKQKMLDKVKQSKDIIVVDDDPIATSQDNRRTTTVSGYSNRNPLEVLDKHPEFRSFDRSPHDDDYYDSRFRRDDRYHDRYDPRYDDHRYDPRYGSYHDRERSYNAPPPSSGPRSQGGYSNRNPLEVLHSKERSYRDPRHHDRGYNDRYYDPRYDQYHDRGNDPKSKFLGNGYNPGRKIR